MNIFKKLYRKAFGPKTEIEFVEAALQRYNARFDEIQEDFWRSGGVCCVYCYSQEASWLASKIERVEHRLQVLKNRKLQAKR